MGDLASRIWILKWFFGGFFWIWYFGLNFGNILLAISFGETERGKDSNRQAVRGARCLTWIWFWQL